MSLHEWKTGFDIGRGYDLLTGTVKGNAFERPEDKDMKDLEVKEGAKVYKVISNSTQFKEALKADASLSVQAWGGKLSASAEYLSETTSKASSITLAAITTIQKSGKEVKTTVQELSPRAKNLLKKNPNDFFNEFGAYFVAGVIKGGTFIGTYCMQFKEETKRQEMAGKIAGIFNKFSAKAEASIKAEVKDYLASTDVAAKTWGTTDPRVQSMEELSKSFDDFDEKLGEGRSHLALVRKWTDLHAVAECLPDGYKAPHFDNKQEGMLTILHEEYQEFLNLVERTKVLLKKENRSKYNSYQRMKIEKAQSKAGEGINKILRLLEKPTNVPENPTSEFRKNYLNAGALDEELTHVLQGDIKIKWHLHFEDKGWTVEGRSVRDKSGVYWDKPGDPRNQITVTQAIQDKKVIFNMQIFRHEKVKRAARFAVNDPKSTWNRLGPFIDVAKAQEWKDGKSDESKAEHGTRNAPEAEYPYNWFTIWVE